MVLVVGHAGRRVFSTTTAGLLSTEGPSLVLVAAVDKEGKGSDETRRDEISSQIWG